MKRSTIMAIASIVALVFGIAFLVVPAWLMSTYGVTLEAAGQWVGRYFGSALVGIAAVTWLARNAPESEGVRAVVIGDLVVSFTGLVVAVLDVLFGVGNALLWLNVVIYLLLTLGFGYLQFGKPKEA